MTKEQKHNLAALRLEASLNGTSFSEVEAYADNMVVDTTKRGMEFVDDGTHGYLLVPPSHKLYRAAQLLSTSPYNYTLLDGTVCLEEDVDAGTFEDLLDPKTN